MRSDATLSAGDWVEVRSREEILRTLDDDACLDSMPFMPEMMKYAGQRLQVSKRAVDRVNGLLVSVKGHSYAKNQKSQNTGHHESV